MTLLLLHSVVNKQAFTISMIRENIVQNMKYHK